MKLLTLGNSARLAVLAGLIAVGVSAATVTQTAPASQPTIRAIQIVDGSESTGKPPKPHGRLTVQPTRALLADGSESTSKPPKPKNNA